jgi:CheY-like chemotaxis protein
MSKIEANKFDLSYQDFDFEKLMQKVVNVINSRVEERQQIFNVRMDSSIPASLVGDDQRLTQVITNLLSNAIKFTPEQGTIRLNALLVKEEDGVFTIQIEVSDTGIGISDEQKDRLFGSFQQADSSISRKFGGTGLGLAISKRIVEMMGGSIWVNSKLNEGSTFAFTFQAKKGSGESVPLLKSGVSRESLRILTVDDDPDILDYFKEIMQRFKIRCDTAGSGEEALSLISARGPYDIYFIDWKMPRMDGIELSRQIKEFHFADTENVRQDKSVVIMISAVEWSAIEKEARLAGVSKFLSKPLFASVITDMINECLGSGAEASASGSALEGILPGCFKGRRILLAEDIEINREIVLSFLEPTMIEIDCAENGLEALNKFRADPEKYEMIFMDVHMPEMDGYEATRQIRALEAEALSFVKDETQRNLRKQVPIVAMTANVFRQDVEKCLEAGMNDHIGKPLDFNEVLNKLNKYLLQK